MLSTVFVLAGIPLILLSVIIQVEYRPRSLFHIYSHFQDQKVCNLPTDPVIISLASSPSSSVMVRNNITLTCSVVLPDGVTGTPDYQWMGPAGGIIDTATHSSNDHSVSSVLTLSEIAPSQAGEYTCTATLANGASNAISINVTVQSKFPILLFYLA